MNTKGFTFILSLMLGVTFFFLGLALAPAMLDVSNEAMNGSQLNCSLTNLTTMDNIVCTQLDMFGVIIIALCFGLAGAVIGGIV